MPLKKIGNLEENNKNEDYNFFSAVIATSPFFGDIMQGVFSYNKNQVLITGQPRNDELFKDKKVRAKLGLDTYTNCIIWLPTFRKSSRLHVTNTEEVGQELNFPLVNTIKRMQQLNELLKKSNTVLVIKPHPMQDLNQDDLIKYSHIKVIVEDELRKHGILLYHLLGETKALITDYSSVYFDYLLLDKPIAFTIDDLDAYGNNRGFVVDNPLDLMPGEIVKDCEAFEMFINKVAEGNDTYKEVRKRINDKCNTYQGGNACANLLKQCKISND